MKQRQIIAACHALDKLMGQDIRIGVAKKVFDLREQLQPAWDFQVMQENKIIGKYPHVDPENLTVKCGNEEESEEALLGELDGFIREFNELAEMEQNISIEPFSIKVEEENIKMAGNDIKALKGFITFK